MNEADPDLTPSRESAGPAIERRRPAWAEFRHSHPGIVATMVVALVAFIAMDAWILMKRRRYDAEIERLRASMTTLERQRTDEIVSQEQNNLRLAIQLIRRQAQLEHSLHLSVSLDSGAMVLEREGAMLRKMPVQIGPERPVGVAPDTVRLAAPRGARTIARIVGEADAWEVPEWVFADRGIQPPSNRVIPGALGVALLLEGGTVIYSLPQRGPLSDSAYVLPGAVRARSEDLRAVLPNLSAGMRVYFY